jgi:hypothetical protein
VELRATRYSYNRVTFYHDLCSELEELSTLVVIEKAIYRLRFVRLFAAAHRPLVDDRMTTKRTLSGSSGQYPADVPAPSRAM